MAQNLTDLTIDEISLVDDGANQHAEVVIVKAKTAPEGFSGLQESAEADSTTEIQMDLENLAKALEDAEAKLVALEKRTTDAEAALTGATEVIKAKDAEIEALTKAAKPAKEEIEDEEEDEEDEDKVMKSLPESVRKRLEAADTALTELAKMREERDTAEAIAKAKSLNFGKAEEIGPLLLRVRKGTTVAADADMLEGLFKAAGEQGRVTHLFKAIGSEAAVEGDPESLLNAKATEIAKAHKLTFEQGYTKAVEQNPALYSAYIAKRRVAG